MKNIKPVGNYNLQKALEEFKKGLHSLDKKAVAEKYLELKEKATFAVTSGLFEHHTDFCYYDEKSNCVYYHSYFGTGWHKRKVTKDGWFKYLSLAFNIKTGNWASRKDTPFRDKKVWFR